jgi:hypothetical protein
VSTRLSARFAVALLLLVLVASIPVVVHDRGLLDTDPCKDPGALKATLLIPGSQPTFEKREPKPREIAYVEGVVDAGVLAVPPLRYVIARSFDPTWITSRPAGLVIPRFEAQKREMVWLERDGQRLPVHWLIEETRRAPHFAAFFFVVDGQPVESPMSTLLGNAFQSLFGGARPIGVVVIGGASLPRDVDKVHIAAEDWIFSAWDHYRGACGFDADPV